MGYILLEVASELSCFCKTACRSEVVGPHCAMKFTQYMSHVLDSDYTWFVSMAVLGCIYPQLLITHDVSLTSPSQSVCRYINITTKTRIRRNIHDNYTNRK